MARFPVRASFPVCPVLLIMPRLGMCVLVSKADPLTEKDSCEGVLIGHSATELHVMFDGRWHLDNKKWRYDKKLSFWRVCC